MLGQFFKHLKYREVLPVCFYHVAFLNFLGGGFSTIYLYNINVAFIKCVSKYFFVSCNNVLFYKVYIITSNKPFACKIRFNECLKSFISIYFFFTDTFSKIFSITTYMCFLFVPYLSKHFLWKGSFCFSVSFFYIQLFEILQLQRKSGFLLRFPSLMEHIYLQHLEIYLKLTKNCFQNFPDLVYYLVYVNH